MAGAGKEFAAFPGTAGAAEFFMDMMLPSACRSRGAIPDPAQLWAGVCSRVPSFFQRGCTPSNPTSRRVSCSLQILGILGYPPVQGVLVSVLLFPPGFPIPAPAWKREVEKWEGIVDKPH